MLTPYQIATAKGGSVFVFDYAHCDLAQTFAYGAGSWGSYQADSTVSVGQNLSPLFDSSGNSQAGTITISIPLAHIPTFTEAHVNWTSATGSAFTVSYTRNGGTTWTTLSEDGRVPLAVGDDFDIKLSLTGGVASDPTQITGLNVYVFSDNKIYSEDQALPVTFSTATFGASGGSLTGILTVNLDQQIDNPAPPPPPNVAGTPYSQPFQTIEFWARVDSGTSIFTSSLPASITTTTNSGTVYVDGVLNGTPTLTDGQFHYFVVVGNFTTTVTASLSGGLTVNHLAAYPQAFTATDVTNNYNLAATLVVNDTGSIGVTESSPVTDIYAYAWQIVSGSS